MVGKHTYLFTSESVTEGHPDKVADQISDAILDAIYREDPNGRIACETLVTTGLAFVAGEITTSCYVEIPKVVRETIKEIGYTEPEYGFDYQTCGVVTAIQEQSQDISQGVDIGGAGDQGCIKKDTLVRTNKGFLPIQDVKEGDLVVTPHGLKKVLKTRMTGIKNIMKLTFSNGMCLECTPEHRILCYRKDGKTYWKSASKLEPRDFVCILKPSNFYSSKYATSKVEKRKFFTKYNHKIYGPEKIILDNEIAYLIGLLIGDGSLTNKKLIELSFGKDRKSALRVKKMLEEKFPNQWRLIQAKDGTISLKADSVLIRKHFENFGVGYNKSPQKVTPRVIFSSPKSVIKAYLRGLFDSDGTIVSNTGRKKKNIRIRLSSSSYNLLEETQLLLNEFRIKSAIVLNSHKGTAVGRDKRYKSKYDNFALNIVGFESYQNFGKEIGFLYPSKAQRIKKYLEANFTKPKNSPSIYLIPHPHKEEMIGEELIGKKLPFALTNVKKKIEKPMAEVYDLEIEDVNIFSANGIFVHNSMFGYATNETKELMPLPIMLAHKLTYQLSKIRKQKEVNYLRPDGKSQVTVEYHKGKPQRVEAIVLSAHHSPRVKMEKIRHDLKELVIDKVIPKNFMDKKTKIFINPTGRFAIGGPLADTGVTGRKIIIDTYGGVGSHGGGAFSGKDPTKVDRSASYYARYIAKNIVAAGLADRCEIQLAYAIGVVEPVSLMVNTFNTGKISEERLKKLIRETFDMRPASIIEQLKLRRPIYKKTACYGHFGRQEEGFTWEEVDRALVLKKRAK